MRYKLGDIASIGSSKRIFAKEYVASGIPFYRGKEIIKKSKNEIISDKLYISEGKYNLLKEKYGVPEIDDLLITAVGTIGKSYMVTKGDLPFYFKDGNIIRIHNWNKNIVVPKYIYYWFNSELGQTAVREIQIGSTQKAITIKEIENLNIYLPCMDVQNKIVKILDGFADKIKLNQQINDNLAA